MFKFFKTNNFIEIQDLNKGDHFLEAMSKMSGFDQLNEDELDEGVGDLKQESELFASKQLEL